MNNTFDTAAYLQRIGLSSPPTADLAGLAQLHQAHFYSIPFENFDIPLGRGIDVAPSAIFNKLVHQQRGGYCFETNGLLLQALQQFGFQCRALLARVHLGPTPSGRSHQLSLVTIADQDWLVDAGFGSQTPRQPICLSLNQKLTTDLQTFLLREEQQFGIMLQMKNEGKWDDLYSFDMNPVHQGDIDYANHCTATLDTSTFTNVWLAALPNRRGITTLLNRSLRVTTDGETKITELPAGQVYLEAIEQHFGLNLQATYEQLKAFNKDFL